MKYNLSHTLSLSKLTPIASSLHKFSLRLAKASKLHTLLINYPKKYYKFSVISTPGPHLAASNTGGY